MKYIIPSIILLASAVAISACHNINQTVSTRTPVDTIGFTQYRWQIDSVLQRIERLQPGKLAAASEALKGTAPLRVGISPHDDYSYVGYLYPSLFQHVNSDVVILFGVGHKARSFRLEDRIVFGSYGRWKSPAGGIKVSGLQKALQMNLPGDMQVVHDSLQSVEHSIEALIPFLEYYNPGVEIIPVIVPAMSYERMETISEALASAVIKTMDRAGLSWGSGWSIIITTDAVHYGNEDWGGKNYDRFGVDSAGYLQAVAYEESIMNTMLTGDLSPEKIKAFSQCTVQDSDYHEYKWTWCGRYAVPLGLLTAYRIAEMKEAQLNGIAAGYSTSIANPPIPVYDIGMGITAPAKLTHWVGYAAVAYR